MGRFGEARAFTKNFLAKQGDYFEGIGLGFLEKLNATSS